MKLIKAIVRPNMVDNIKEALAKLNYYRGPINGQLDDATRRSLFAFQIDRQLSGIAPPDSRASPHGRVPSLPWSSCCASGCSSCRLFGSH